MLSIPLEKAMETELKSLAVQMKKPFAECLQEAVSEYIEDRQDYMAGQALLPCNGTSHRSPWMNWKPALAWAVEIK